MNIYYYYFTIIFSPLCACFTSCKTEVLVFYISAYHVPTAYFMTCYFQFETLFRNTQHHYTIKFFIDHDSHFLPYSLANRAAQRTMLFMRDLNLNFTYNYTFFQLIKENRELS